MPHFIVREIKGVFHASLGKETTIFQVGYLRLYKGWYTHSEFDNRSEAQAMADYLNEGK